MNATRPNFTGQEITGKKKKKSSSAEALIIPRDRLVPNYAAGNTTCDKVTCCSCSDFYSDVHVCSRAITCFNLREIFCVHRRCMIPLTSSHSSSKKAAEFWPLTAVCLITAGGIYAIKLYVNNNVE